MPRSRNTSIRRKNTSRAEARRRFRDEHREIEDEPTGSVDGEEAADATAAQPKPRSALAIPDVVDDLRHLREVFSSPWLLVPFGMLVVTLVLAAALASGALVDVPSPFGDLISLYLSLTLNPINLFVYFIGGFVAKRGSYIVGGVLGVFSGLIWVIYVALATDTLNEQAQELLASTGGTVAQVDASYAFQNIALGLVVGVLAGGFASWYRRFLRSSQERAAANRAAREREQAEKAKEQARADREAVRAQKYAEREARRKSNSG